MPWVSQAYLNSLERAAAAETEARLLRAELARLVKYVRRIAGAEHAGRLSISTISQAGSMLTFNINLPTNQDETTVKGELTYTVGSSEPVSVETSLGQTVLSGLTGNHGDPVAASFVWIDNAGNRSVTPSTLEATLLDTIPPGDPGQLSITVTGETS